MSGAYQYHPSTVTMVAQVKNSYDARERNTINPTPLGEFYAKHDKNGTGEVRVEDFRAGMSLGGVKLGPTEMNRFVSAYGVAKASETQGIGSRPATATSSQRPGNERPGHINYQAVLSDMGGMPRSAAAAITMGHAMGGHTAQHCGYTEAPELMNTLGRTDGTLTSRSAFATTSATSTLKGTGGASLKTTTRVFERLSDSQNALLASLRAHDPRGTGTISLDAFLHAAVKAGLALQPAELDDMRARGMLGRPHAGAPTEQVCYSSLMELLPTFTGRMTSTWR